MYSSYNEIPELTPEDILPESGFYIDDYEQHERIKDIYIGCVAEAIINPDWLKVPIYSEEHKLRELQQLPRPHYASRQDILLLEQMHRKSGHELWEIAKK